MVRNLPNHLKSNTGRIVVFDFFDKKGLIKGYHRLKTAKKVGHVTFEKIAKRGNSLYIQTSTHTD